MVKITTPEGKSYTFRANFFETARSRAQARGVAPGEVDA